MTWSFERKLVAAAMVAWTATALINLLTGPPLGHDEAVYAIFARGDAPTWLYRSRGMTVLAALGFALGDADGALRVGGLVANLAVVPAVFALGRAAFDARTGAWAAAVIAGTYPMISRSAVLLGDLPATAAGVLGLAIVVGELTRAAPPGSAPGPRWRITLAAVAFAAAFYVRYGSAPVIALAAPGAVVLWWRAIRARPWPVIATVALFVALLVPHFVLSLRHTGALLGVLETSAGVPRRTYWGAGLVTYVTANPLLYYGVLVTPLLIAGLTALARPRARAAWYLALVGTGQVVAIGLYIHAQPRYVFIAVVLLTIVGADALRARLPSRPQLALAAALLAWLGATIACVVINRLTATHRTTLTAAAGAILTHRARASCIVVTMTGPQLAWYTGCAGVPTGWDDDRIRDAALDRFLASTPYAPLDGPSYAAAHQLTVIELPTGRPDARLWRVR